MKHRSILIVAFLSLFWIKIYAEHPQIWTTVLLPIGEFRELKFSFWQQERFELSRFKLVDNRYSLYVKKKLREWLDGEVHYTLIYSRRVEENPFRLSRRLELELNPHFHLTEKTELKFRNRYEFINSEDPPKEVQKFRQRQQIVWKLDQGTLKTYSIHNEVFYNVTTDRFDEYRIVPLELGFGFGEKHVIKIYQMIRTRKPSDHWMTQYVCGLTLEL